jgi:hypothetical protein
LLDHRQTVATLDRVEPGLPMVKKQFVCHSALMGCGKMVMAMR